MANAVFVVDSLAGGRRGADFATLEDASALALHNSVGTAVVNAVFPWGTDAAFNRVQIPQLLAEWRLVLEVTDEQATRENLQAVLNFIEGRVTGGADKYVVFVSD